MVFEVFDSVRPNVFGYEIKRNGTMEKGLMLQYSLEFSAKKLVARAFGPGIDEISVTMFPPHINFVGTFYTVLRQIRTDIAAGRVPNSISSFEELREFKGIHEYCKKSHSTPNIHNKEWHFLLDLVDIWLKDRANMGC